MKKQLIFCLAVLGLSLSACEDPGKPTVIPNKGILSIESIYPEFAVRGGEIIIAGQNFGSGISDNHVSVNGQFSEVTYVEPGRRIVAIVPKYLTPGEHTLSLSANGQYCIKKILIVENY